MEVCNSRVRKSIQKYAKWRHISRYYLEYFHRNFCRVTNSTSWKNIQISLRVTNPKVKLLFFHFRVTFTYLTLINHSLWKTYYFSSNIDWTNLVSDWNHPNFFIKDRLNKSGLRLKPPKLFDLLFRWINFANPKAEKDFEVCYYISIYVVYIFFNTWHNWCRPLTQEWNHENFTIIKKKITEINFWGILRSDTYTYMLSELLDYWKTMVENIY